MILANLFNAIPDKSKLRFNVLTSLLSFVNESGAYDSLPNQFSNLESWAVEWKLEPTELASLYWLIAKVQNGGKREKEGFAVQVKWLRTLEQVPNLDWEAYKVQVASVCLNAIRIDDLFQFDALMDNALVARLADDATYKVHHSLLRIFVYDKMEQLNAFMKEHPSFLREHDLGVDALQRKLRLLSLTQLALASFKLTYEEVASSLVIDIGAVEQWVMDAVAVGLIDARIDGINKVVFVSRATQRAFSSGDWKMLQTNLGEWKKNVASILGVIQNAKSSAAAMK